MRPGDTESHRHCPQPAHPRPLFPHPTRPPHPGRLAGGGRRLAAGGWRWPGGGRWPGRPVARWPVAGGRWPVAGGATALPHRRMFRRRVPSLYRGSPHDHDTPRRASACPTRSWTVSVPRERKLSKICGQRPTEPRHPRSRRAPGTGPRGMGHVGVRSQHHVPGAGSGKAAGRHPGLRVPASGRCRAVLPCGGAGCWCGGAVVSCSSAGRRGRWPAAPTGRTRPGRPTPARSARRRSGACPASRRPA